MSRSALIEEVQKYFVNNNIHKNDLAEVIAKQPTVEAKPVVHAKWLPIGMRAVGLYSPTHYCSECKGHGFDYYDFCNNCGCDMRGGKNE